MAGTLNVVADALCRAPWDRVSDEEEAVDLEDFTSRPPSFRVATMRVVDDEDMRKAKFAACHNSTQGHHGVHRTISELEALGIKWARMSRDVARWIAECPECQKIRAAQPILDAMLSPIGAFSIFEELSVDFIGPMPTDELQNSYIFNAVCSTSRYCELFAVEAATAIVAAHCLLAIVARYGCFKVIRSDRGSHFVNEVIEEFLRLFEIQSILTLAQRPQANGIAERNGGEVIRHLKALVMSKGLRPLWSVMLPLVMMIINRSYKPSIGAVHHRLLHWAQTDLDKGVFAPFKETTEAPVMNSPYVRALESAYEKLLDATSEYILEEQDKFRAQFEGKEPTEFKVGSLVLVSYLVRPPTKLHCRWGGPYEVVSRERNNVIVQDLTSDARHEYDVSRLRLFLVADGVDAPTLAAADLGEAEVLKILRHEGTAKDRKSMRFEVEWSDVDVTWEPWDAVRRLAHLDEYVIAHPEHKLKALLTRPKVL